MTFELMGREAPLVEIRSIECFIDIDATSLAFLPDLVPTTSLVYQSTHGVLLPRVVSCPISQPVPFKRSQGLCKLNVASIIGFPLSS